MILFENDSNSAAFYFAAEEYIMRYLKPDVATLMLWSTGDTIMIGANQITEAECDLAYAREAGIEVVRRSSGGGSIYTDHGTLQVTVIQPFGADDDCRNIARESITGPIIGALASRKVKASAEGRNDIVIEGRKVSGIAQYVKDGYICSHCSLLFGTDLEKLERSLTVDRSKYETKAIASARARVANITEYIAEKDMQSFIDELTESFNTHCHCESFNTHCHCEEHRNEAIQNMDCRAPLRSARNDEMKNQRFSADELAEIETIMNEKYLNPEWTFGREPAFTYTNKKRFHGGLLEVFLDVKGGVIKNARINGDFLSLMPVGGLEEILEDVPHREDALAEALGAVDVKQYLGSLGASELLETLL